MKVGDAIAEILKREGIDILIGYPVNHVLDGGKPEQQATLQVADAVAVLGPDTNEAVGTVRGCLR